MIIGIFIGFSSLFILTGIIYLLISLLKRFGVKRKLSKEERDQIHNL